MRALPYLFSRLSLTMISIPLLLNSPLVHSALTVMTANTIQGKGPYLTFDNGTTKVTTTDGLLGIMLSDGTTITVLSDTSRLDAPIKLPNIDDSFASIKTLVPLPSEGNSAYPSIELSDVIKTYNYWGDDDGDDNPSATGSLLVKWQDESGSDITNLVKSDPSTVMTGCDAPYILTITAMDGLLSTQYGDPSSTSFNGSSHSYYIEPKQSSTPYACFAKPNLMSNFGNQPEWNPTKGFKVQDINLPSSNFPTMGFNKAFFDLTIIGASSSTVTPVQVSGSANVSLTLSEVDTNVVRVTLNGPDRTNQGAFTPTTFELYSGTTKVYSFELAKWFIAKTGTYQYNSLGDWSGTPLTPNYCANLTGNYQVPSIGEYTNGRSISWSNNSLPGWSSNTYARKIGGGLFAEWGSISNSSYKDSGFDSYFYWAVQPYGKYQQYVHSSTGRINYTFPNGTDGKTACVSA